MAASSGLRAHLADVLAPLGSIKIRSMFGGAGVYCQGVMIALIAEDVLYFRSDSAKSPPTHAPPGIEPFTYARPGGKRIAMRYWRAPEALFDDDDAMRTWARASLAGAVNDATK